MDSNNCSRCHKPLRRRLPKGGDLCWDCRRERALLPILDHYPDHSILPRCRHGLADGTCAACEKTQRAGLVFADDLLLTSATEGV